MKQLEKLIIEAKILTEPEAEVERVMQVCNACRYCEGFCAVFPAMTQRLEFGKADINYLANLCHNCGACLHACQYAPPHEFAINVPKAMAEVRLETYQHYAQPAAFGALYRQAGVTVTLALVFSLILFLLLAMGLKGSLLHPPLAGDFYQIFPVLLKFMIDAGADIIGDPSQSHCVAIDARAPLYDGGICTRVDCVSLGVVVNRDAVRFYDEGEDFWPKRYAIWGRLVAHQPGQIGYSIIDSKAIGHFMPPVFPGAQANTIAELARQLGLDGERLAQTIADYNAACAPGQFDHTRLDNCATSGLTPAKTHWARPIDTPPYYGYALRPGITFTYLGLYVDDTAAVHFAGQPSRNLFVAGEMMAGNVLGKGYTAGVGMSIGTTFGRIAGQQAARAAQQEKRHEVA